MTVTMAVLTTDGRRECIERTIASAEANVAGDIVDRIIFTDSDPAYGDWLTATFPLWWVESTGQKAGYAAAMHQAFMRLETAQSPHVFWLEDDFTFNRTVDADLMCAVLNDDPHLAQMALRRQPWNDAERAAGGIVEQHPDWYVEHGVGDWRWLRQSAFWTNNPNVFPLWVAAAGWPLGRESEGRFTFKLRDADPDVRFGFWGARDSGEWVHHIGEVRVGAAY